MSPVLRIPRRLYKSVRSDLKRPHPFAAERVGFLSAAPGSTTDSRLVLLSGYTSLPDERYVPDPFSGARIDSRAIQGSLQRVLDTGRGEFHVHMHPGRGMPRLSRMDRDELPRIVRSLCVAGPRAPHGIVLLSQDSITAWVWLPEARAPVRPSKVTIVGYPMSFVFGHCHG